jgi:hypothetical protein
MLLIESPFIILSICLSMKMWSERAILSHAYNTSSERCVCAALTARETSTAVPNEPIVIKPKIYYLLHGEWISVVTFLHPWLAPASIPEAFFRPQTGRVESLSFLSLSLSHTRLLAERARALLSETAATQLFNPVITQNSRHGAEFASVRRPKDNGNSTHKTRKLVFVRRAELSAASTTATTRSALYSAACEFSKECPLIAT